MEFFNNLALRNLPLFYFGWACLAGAFISGLLILLTDTQVLGINAWIKPFKFFLSSFLFVWTMGWLLGYLTTTPVITVYTWVVIGVMAFELIYITWQAAQGQLSHFNVSTQFHGTMFSLMGFAISIMTLFTAYIGYLFFIGDFPELPTAYLWGIRLGILLFVVFAFEGGLMGARLSHTVGAPDGGSGIPLLNWSLTHGDLRIAHFVGMHALQVLPLLGYYVFSTSRSVILVAIVYGLIALMVMIQALNGVPLVRISTPHKSLASPLQESAVKNHEE